jgi:membrane peptidoglycan carboxypeptidase
MVLEVKNNSGEILKKWTDTAPVQIVDPQSAYIVTDILHDEKARQPLDGYHAVGMYIPGIETATKTGTSDKDGKSKDIWMASYSPVLTMAVWLGNSAATILKSGTSIIPGPIIATVMTYAHKEVYASEGLWKAGDWYSQPTGIQKVGGELYPAWWSADQGKANSKLAFDQVSKKKATSCTPDTAKIELDITKLTDPVTKKDIIIAPTGYNGSADDDVHKCDDTPASVTVSLFSAGSNTYDISVIAAQGTFPVSVVAIQVNGTTVATITAPGPYTYTYTVPTTATDPQTVSAIVTDTGLYTNQANALTTIPGFE